MFSIMSLFVYHDLFYRSVGSCTLLAATLHLFIFGSLSVVCGSLSFWKVSGVLNYVFVCVPWFAKIVDWKTSLWYACVTCRAIFPQMATKEPPVKRRMLELSGLDSPDAFYSSDSRSSLDEPDECDCKWCICY